MSFEKWCKENDHDIFSIGLEEAYKAGAQSRQAEIDYWKNEYLKTCDEFGDLVERIDDAVEWIESNKKNIPLSEWHGYTTEEYVDADDLLDILRGKNHD